MAKMAKFGNIKEYLKRKKALNDAKRWLKANDANQIAARCLFHLNHKVRMTDRNVKTSIYDLKSLVIRDFYLRGYCVSVTKHLQTLPCWHSWEYNEGWEDICAKCQGSGIYAQHELYQFVFDIKGRTYVWHQPVSLVNFLVDLTNPEITEYQPGKRAANNMTGTEWVILYQAVLYQYLRLSGIQVDELPKLPSWQMAFRLQWHESVTKPFDRKWYWDWQPNLRIRQHRLWRFIKTGKLPESIQLDDEIPF